MEEKDRDSMGAAQPKRRAAVESGSQQAFRMEWDKRKYLCAGLGVLSAVLLGVSGFTGWKFFHRYSEGDAIYSQVRELAEVPEVTDDMERSDMDFSGLLAANPECVGWISIPGTDIEYPIARGDDNDKYLHQAFTGEYSDLGSIFMDYRNGADFTDANTVLYGHDMWIGGAMFSKLTEYQDPDFLAEHPEVDIHTVDGRLLRYKVFAVRVVDETDIEAYTRVFGSDSEFISFADRIMEEQLYNTMEKAEPGDHVLSLSTCTNVLDNERLLVHCLLEE